MRVMRPLRPLDGDRPLDDCQTRRPRHGGASQSGPALSGGRRKRRRAHCRSSGARTCKDHAPPRVGRSEALAAAVGERAPLLMAAEGRRQAVCGGARSVHGVCCAPGTPAATGRAVAFRRGRKGASTLPTLPACPCPRCAAPKHRRGPHSLSSWIRQAATDAAQTPGGALGEHRTGRPVSEAVRARARARVQWGAPARA